ncbi:MAG: hypothetical protein ACJ795_14225 [Ktedonobacteraceae bacterium]
MRNPWASRNRQTDGAGLGLTIAQQIFRAHGGAVFVGFLLASRNTIIGKKKKRVALHSTMMVPGNWTGR